MSNRIGEILLHKGMISVEQLEHAMARQQETQQYLGRILIDAQAIGERELLDVLSEQHGIPIVDLKRADIAGEVVRQVPAKFAWHYNVMPVRLADSTLTVALSNPYDVLPVDDLETNLGYRVEKVLASLPDIQDAIRRYYGVAADTIERIMAEDPDQQTYATGTRHDEIEDLERMAETTSVIRVVNQILHQAIQQRATDIHLECFRHEAFLRFRVDGVLRDARVSGDIRYLYPAVVSRIKIMSGLDIIERRLPQDGRAKVKIGTLEYDLRVSIIPTIHGENVVVRILPTSMLFSLTDLGMSDTDLAALQRLIRQPNGIVFVTGPTGSGKSTTLYAALKTLNGRELKLVTIEDPVEYELKGVSQVQVRPRIGLSFAATLRSMLRHDPDVIMVGEIRDLETANIATRAALTGHLVLSTLHTNDAAGGISRLLDIGIEPYLVASSVRAFIAQRLVRVICPACSEPATVDSATLAMLGLDGKDTLSARRGRGCDACENTGYSGRTGIYEILPVTEHVAEMILEKTAAGAIKRDAVKRGMKLLMQDGIDKIRDGITTPDEVLRVSQTTE